MKRRRLQALAAGLIFLLALKGLVAASVAPAGPAGARPALKAVAVSYRPDGGQAVGGGPLRPNALTRLNLGLKIDLAGLDPRLLAHLPGQGRRSAALAGRRGCLTARESRLLAGLIDGEPCARNKP
ncbi:MAG: hypothetical protein LBS31_04805 [Candidatus Adiutrix sp.]|jgi:hypothetical protein|nr:hypothetical protein [Candidatus Adiutrix sp.]